MTTALKLYVDEIGEAIVTAIKTLQAEVGLKIVEQGDWARMPAPKDFDDVMPLALVSYLGTGAVTLKIGRLETAYNFRVRYFRRQADTGENPARETNKNACRIWQVLATGNPATNPPTPLIPDLMKTSIAGLEWISVECASPSMENEDNAFLNAAELRANCAWLEVTVTARSVQYHPA